MVAAPQDLPANGIASIVSHAIKHAMTSIERGPGLSNVILGVASGAMLVVVTMFGFWEVHQENARTEDRQVVQSQIAMMNVTINHVYELEQAQAVQMATLQQMELRNRGDIEAIKR